MPGASEQKKPRCVIFAGAAVSRYDIVRSYLREDDYIIACDCGLRHVEALGLEPDLILGDFDSYPKPDGGKETIVLPREKDDTDSVYAVKCGLARGFDAFLLCGVFGNRLDHTLVNVSALLMLHSLGKSALALDDYSELSILGKEPVLIPDRFPYFSLLNVSGTAKKINIRHAKWELTDAEISCDYQYGCSNEVLPGETAEVSVGEGRALLIKIFEP